MMSVEHSINFTQWLTYRVCPYYMAFFVIVGTVGLVLVISAMFMSSF